MRSSALNSSGSCAVKVRATRSAAGAAGAEREGDDQQARSRQVFKLGRHGSEYRACDRRSQHTEHESVDKAARRASTHAPEQTVGDGEQAARGKRRGDPDHLDRPRPAPMPLSLAA